ncbi:hypothetical protein HDU99_002755, partial [Rhizoclosmatium hyalinum]
MDRERTWSHARPFPAPPPHTIGNTPGIKVASVKAQFYKWKPGIILMRFTLHTLIFVYLAPEKEPVDFSEDDLYIIDEPDEDMDAEGQTGGEDNEAANEDDDAMETDTNELKQQLSESLGGGSSSTRSSGLKVNTHASRFLANNSNSFSNTPPNSEFHLLAKERRCVRELEVYGQLSYAAAAKQALLVFIPIQATYASTVQPQFRNNDAELMEEPWYLQMNQIARIFDETEINAACQLSFITKSRQEFKFLCDSSSSYRHWIQLLDECFDECHPFEGLSNLYDLRGRRPSYGDSESSTYSSLPTHSPVRSSSAASGGSKVPSWNASMDSKNQEKKYTSDKWSMGKAATKSFVSTPPHPPPALASRSFSSPSGSRHVETHGNSFRFDSLERRSQVSDVPSSVVSRVKEERRKSMSGIKTSSVQVDSGSKRMSTGATSIKEFFVDSLKRIPSLKNRNSTGSRQDYDETHTSTKTKVVDTKLQDDQIWQPPAYLVPTPSFQPTAQTESVQQTTIHLQQHTTYGTENQQLYPQQPISTKKPVSKRGVRKRGSLLELWDDIPLGQVNLKSVDESLNANEEVSISKVSESLDANEVVLVSEVGESQVVNEVVSITEEASATGVSNASTKVESVHIVMEMTKPKDLDIQLPESSHNSESQIAAVPIASVTSVASLFRGIPSLEDLQKYEAELDSIASSLPTSPIRKAAIPIVPPLTPVATESEPVSSTSTEVVKSVTALNNDVSVEVVKSVTTITEETQRKDYPSIYVAPPRSRGERRSSAFVSKLRETTEQILREGKLTPISSSPPQLESVDLVKSVMEMSSVHTSANQTRAQETSMSSQANNTIAIQQSVIKTEKVFVEKPTVNLELSEYFDMTVDPIVQSDAAISTDCSTDYDDDIILPKTPCHSP